MRTLSNYLLSGWFLLVTCLLVASGCSRPSFLVGIGTGGKYMEAKDEITRRRGGNVDKAILNLEGIVRDNPT
ncbi:MAG: hypothetical protein ACREQA_07945, partial [Candidatus Binatia bacterium]